MLSLARRGCAVSSRNGAAGWRVDLEPEHFLGEAYAEVFQDDTAPRLHGTAVTFPASGTENLAAIRRAVEDAARHYPLPVIFDDGSGGAAAELNRRAFLDGAVHAERWRGLVLGVFKNRRHRFGEPDLNFHGLTVSVSLPRTESVHGACWSVAADIDDCPELELVLPARKEAVETPFLEELRGAARLAVYRAMAADPDPRPSFGDRKRAHEADIDIAAPPRELRPWRPGTADIEAWREPPKLEPVAGNAMIVNCDSEPPEAQALWRAARRKGMSGRLYEPDRRLEGYAWYGAVERIAGVQTEIAVDGRTHALEECPVRNATGGAETRPETIRVNLTVKTGGGQERILGLSTDLAFAGEAWCWVEDAAPLVTGDSDIEPYELAQLLRAAYFSPSDDADADSWDRQSSDFDCEALHIATRLLVSDEEARRASIAGAVERDLLWLIPHGADIAVRGRKVTVTLAGPGGEAAP